MKIGDLAQRVGISVETIRFYEQKGLVPPPARTSGNFRDYTEEHLERLTMIRHCRALDMSHEEIQVLLGCLDQPADSCVTVNTILDDHIAHVAHRIADLRQLERRLVALRQRCESPAAVENCGIVQGLAEQDGGTLPHPHSHVGLAHG
jgi:Cd(II)/Pb(II)-responsive transcriptional regulator